jgi:hypothetical protein
MGRASGEHRVEKAILNALDSPLLYGNDIGKAKRILFNIYSSEEHSIFVRELQEIDDFFDQLDPNIDVIWGTATDDSLGEDAKVTILATGLEDDLRSEVQKDAHSNEDDFYEDLIPKLYKPVKREPTTIKEVLAKEQPLPFAVEPAPVPEPAPEPAVPVNYAAGTPAPVPPSPASAAPAYQAPVAPTAPAAPSSMNPADNQVHYSVSSQMTMSSSDVTERSIRDQLTGLFNRAYAGSLIDAKLSMNSRGMLFVMGLDNTGLVNEMFGNIAGDNLLKLFGEALRSYTSVNDVVCRLGGDQFAV